MAFIFPNPPVAITALLAPMTAAIAQQVIVDSLVSMGVRADLWPKEDAAYSVIVSVAALFSSAFNATVLPAIRAGWLPTATGPWLTWVAYYMYGVVRTEATFATGTVKLTNGGGGSYSYAPFAVTFQKSSTKTTYTNLDAISLAPGPGPTQTINVQATVAGTGSNAAPGEINTIVTTMLGVTCTNLVPVLGIDQQGDQALQQECWDAIAANSPFGPRQAFAYAIETAKNSVTESPVNINRWTISPSSHDGTVTIYVASPSGAADPNDVTGVTTNIEAIARPECVTVTVASATTVADTDVLTVYVRSTPGLVAATVQAAIAASLTTLFRGDNGSNPIGGNSADGGATHFLFAAAVEGACYDAWPPKPTDPTVPWTSAVFQVTGAHDIAVSASQVVVDSITVIVSLV